MLKLFQIFLIPVFFIYLSGCTNVINKKLEKNIVDNKSIIENYIPVNSLEKAAYNQIGVVLEYDRSNGYYAGGNPPEYTGVCSDVVVRALQKIGYDLQEKIFLDIKRNPDLYSDIPDKNINHRRVKNLLVYFENSKDFIKLPNDSDWQAGDIITYKQIPGRLWHTGIVSDLKTKNGIPMLIDNHGYGTNIRISIYDWKSDISGHFRFKE